MMVLCHNKIIVWAFGNTKELSPPCPPLPPPPPPPHFSGLGVSIVTPMLRMHPLQLSLFVTHTLTHTDYMYIHTLHTYTVLHVLAPIPISVAEIRA